MGLSIYPSPMEILAAITGQGLVNFVIQLLIVGLIYWVVTWAVAKCAPPEPFATIIRVVLVIAVAVFLINCLLALAGMSHINW